MTRPYFQVHALQTITKAKWRRTPVGSRGVLLTAWLLGSMQEVEGVWPSREALEADVAADGGVDSVTAAVGRLIELRWIDCDETGCRIHDWGDWQPKIAKSGAQRTREWRERVTERTHDVTAGDEPSSRVVTSVTERHADHVDNVEIPTLEENVPLKRNPLLRRGQRESPPPTRDARASRPSQSVTRPRSPRQQVLRWLTEHEIAQPVGYVNANLNELVRVYGADPIIEALGADTTSKTVKQYVANLEKMLTPDRSNGTPGKGHTRPWEEVKGAWE